MTSRDRPDRVSKAERQRLLLGLLEDHEIQSQAQAVTLLANRGVHTTQATISRDLDELGAVKARGADGTLVYRLPSNQGPAARQQAAEVVRQFLTGVAVSGNLVVLHTPPAGAGPVASAVDLADLPDVLATVAGDDTVLVVTAEDVPASVVAQWFRDLTEVGWAATDPS